MSLIDRMTSFLGGLGSPGTSKRSDAIDEIRVAIAALMFHVMDADGVRREVERDRLSEVLAETFGVSGKELTGLARAGEEADRESIDLYAFTRIIKREFDETKRAEFIEMLWEVVYADGERHELEDNVVWRIAELIGVERRERITLRQRVEARLNIDGDDG